MAIKVYQQKIHLEKVSPMIWRRLLVKDTTTIAQLHGIFQLVLGWENIGDLPIKSQRFYNCDCTEQQQKTFSPL